MRIDANDLKEFYLTSQGKVVQRILRQRIRGFWPDTRGMRVAGLGYATPFLAPFLGEAERVVALMSAHLGAVRWPPEGAGLVAVAHDDALPLETNSVDRILVAHAFEDYAGMGRLLSEAWRVLGGQGRVLMVVPNRTGLWARSDRTPFGYGTPWSGSQIRQALKSHGFVTERDERSLFMPPTESRLLLAMASAWEKPGQAFFSAFGGVHLVEASKQLYAGTKVGADAVPASRRRVVPAAVPIPGAVPRR